MTMSKSRTTKATKGTMMALHLRLHQHHRDQPLPVDEGEVAAELDEQVPGRQEAERLSQKMKHLKCPQIHHQRDEAVSVAVIEVAGPIASPESQETCLWTRTEIRWRSKIINLFYQRFLRVKRKLQRVASS
jgi:hypothetical protein